MKRFIAVVCAALFALGILAWVWLRPQKTVQAGTVAETTSTPAAEAVATTPPPQVSAQGTMVPPVPPAPPAPPAPALPAEVPARPLNPPPLPHEDSAARQEAEAVALNLRHFGQRFGGNPEGTNTEIVKALNGGNPQGARYLPQESLRLNDQGELLDSFGTPYFFHQISSQEMEIRSAGPDKTMWTPDDIAVK